MALVSNSDLHHDNQQLSSQFSQSEQEVSQVMSCLNPFTAKCGQRQISTKFPNFVFKNFDKQIASCESTGRELSFEWSHHRISSIDSKGRG